MPTLELRHPTRDALLRDGLNQLREQRGVSTAKFAKKLNSLAHGTCAGKMTKRADLNSLTDVDEYDSELVNWLRQVERWASGAVEFPAWLEEPWVTALEELGDEETRIALARRHGFLGVRAPEATANHATGFSALGAISQNTGLVMRSFPELLQDGVLDENDADDAPAVIEDLENAIAVLMGAKALIEEKVVKKARLRAVQ